MRRPFPSLAILDRALASRPEPSVQGADLEAAVLLCLAGRAVLLVRRVDCAGDRWSGQVALPGGRHEESDESLLGTALRETREEVGFDPLAFGRVLGALGTQVAERRRAGDVRIAIFAAELVERPLLQLSSEISGAYWVELDELVHAEARVPERPGPVPAYLAETKAESLVVWGITYRILERLRAVE